jgi:hypothetical protein
MTNARRWRTITGGYQATGVYETSCRHDLPISVLQQFIVVHVEFRREVMLDDDLFFLDHAVIG